MYIKGKRTYILHDHYMRILKIINTHFKNMLPSLIPFQPVYADAGYIIIDQNTRTIINAQCAFSKHHIKQYYQEWVWIDY